MAVRLIPVLLAAAMAMGAGPAARALSRPVLDGGLVFRSTAPGPVGSPRCADDAWTRDPDGLGSIGRESLERIWIDVSRLPSGLDPDRVEAAVRDAAVTWNEGRNTCGRPDTSRADFQVVSRVEAGPLPSDDGLNVVLFSDGICTHTTHVACTQWYPDPATGEPLGWDIILDPRWTWGTGAGPWLDVENTIVHELGHVVGLGHVRGWAIDGCGPEHVWLTMYPCTWPGDTIKRRLGLGDSLGLEAVSDAP
jgi:hypothetical protein